MRKKTRPTRTRTRTLLSPPEKTANHPRKSISFKALMTFSCFLLLLLISNNTRAQQWQILANEQDIAATASSFTNITMVKEGAIATPYVVYTESGVAKVKKLQDDNWTQVGGNVAAASASYTRIYADKTGNLYVTYMDGTSGSKLAVKKFNKTSGAWEPLNNNNANLYVSSGSVNNGVSQYSSTPRSSLAFDSNNTPYIAFGDNGIQTPYVKKFDGTSWITVGSGPVSSTLRAVGVSLVIDESDVPWLVFCNVGTTSTGSTGSLALYSYNAGTWTPVTVSIGGIRHTSMALNAAGNLAIAYFNTGSSNKATVIVYNKTAGTWSSATALSSRDAPNLSLVNDISGNLYCSFIDFYSSTARLIARVFKLSANNTAWKELKDPVLTGIDEPVGNLTITPGGDTVRALIVYTKTNTTGVSTPVVRMFTPPAAPAVLSTNTITSVNTTSVVTGGDITDDGGSAITERGIVYGISANPTTANNKTVNAAGGTGTFTTTLTGLDPATYYYARAYATNGAGTTYGNQVTFNTHALPGTVVTAPKQMEFLNRGVVAVRKSTSSVYIGWRLLGTDPSGIAFNIYRDGVKLNSSPITTSTNYLDNTSANGNYTVKAVINGVEGAASAPVPVWANNQLHIPMQIPVGGTTPDGEAYTYAANDCSVGDVDGDGEYEVFVKWEPSAKNDNAGGYSGTTIIDCYKLNGTRLWRIDLGKNVNAGPHFTQFMVYDLDGDGKAEMACKTADGTIDGQGVVIGDPVVDYRNTSGWVQQGPEYLTVFNGLTGAAMATVNYEPARGNISDWGDNYGNRADRFVSAVAYLDGVHPSLVIGRGYYEKLTRAAYDWRDGKLTLRWKFDSEDTNIPANIAYSGQGNHQMTIGDVDGDGKDEVINGSSAINDDGGRLWTNRYGHGDALHMTDMDPDRPGQEIWQCLESPSSYSPNGLRLNDAKTGESIWGVATTGNVGRAMAADIDPKHKGYEVWGSSGNLYNVKGEQISTNKPSYNFGIWWDGDLSRELLDGNVMDKWNPSTNAMGRLFTIYQAAPVQSSNDTKKNPGLTADLFGDWREEMIFRRSDNTGLVIFTTNIPTEQRIYTLMHDPQYRVAVAWQNSGYNQPPYPSFYLGNDMATPPTPNIVVKDILPPTVTSITKQTPASAETTNATSVTYRVQFSEDVQGVESSDFTLSTTGTAAGNITSVSAASGASIDVTVSDITGDGTLRLDVKESNTGITDEAGNALANGFTAGESFSFDHTAPALSPVTMVSSNTQSAYAKEGDVLTLNFTASESIETPVVTIAGRNVTAIASAANSYTATYTMTADDKEGPIAFTIDFNDLVGNAGTQVTATLIGNSIIYDRTSPLINNASVDKPSLLVPNHKMEDIKVVYEVADGNRVSTLLSVTSNEAVNGSDDGDTAPDWQIVDEHNVQLRAERSGIGTGRIYTITITATDIAGNLSTQTLTVTVPLNQKGKNQRTAIALGEDVNMQQGLNVTAYPNPAAQYFTLNIQSSSNTSLDLIVTDIAGRVKEVRNGVAVNTSLTLGHSYQPGVYFVQIVQGTEKLTLKLVKKAD